MATQTKKGRWDGDWYNCFSSALENSVNDMRFECRCLSCKSKQNETVVRHKVVLNILCSLLFTWQRPGKSSLEKDRSLNLKDPTVVGKAWHQKCVAMGHIVSAVRTHRAMKARAWLLFSPLDSVQGSMRRCRPHSRWVFSELFNLSGNAPEDTLENVCFLW